MKKFRLSDAVLIVVSMFSVVMIWLVVKDFMANRASAKQSPLLGVVYPTKKF